MKHAWASETQRMLVMVLGLWAVASLYSVLLHGPMPLYSTRTLGVAWEMWQRGDFLVPHLNGEPYSHKAPLVYWLIHLGWTVGGVGDVWPRLLMVLISTALVGATAALGVALFPERTGPARYAPWVLAGSAFLFLFALQIMFEVLLALSVVLALLALTPALRRDGRPRWVWFALALGAGLLTKGPVALLHLAFPLLLAPWWSPVARAQPGRWYRGAFGALLLAAMVFSIWLVPALLSGGEGYRAEVLWLQTAGRVVDSFDHARPLWWYFMVLPVLGFPWLFWPTLWPRLLRRPGLVEPARRLLTAWLLPTFVVFCLISAKQVYYLVPLMPAAALALARDLDGGAGVNPQARVPWTLLPFALALAATGAIVLLLSYGVSFGYAFNHWVGELSHANPALGAALIVLALTLVLPARERGLALAPRLATITLLATVAGHALFTASLWHYFDLEPVARIIAAGQRAGHQVATSYKYEGEYHFFGRLTEPLLELNDRDLPAWAAAHPDGVLVTRPSGHAPRIEAKPMFEAEFRERRVQIWRAADWLAAEQ